MQVWALEPGKRLRNYLGGGRRADGRYRFQGTFQRAGPPSVAVPEL